MKNKVLPMKDDSKKREECEHLGTRKNDEEVAQSLGMSISVQ
jgi:hypothetical protein